MQLLTPAELQRMRAIGLSGAAPGGSCYRELIAWCADLVHEMNQPNKEHQTPYLSGWRQVQVLFPTQVDRVRPPNFCPQLDTCVLTLRGKLGKLFDYADQPVPFFYVSDSLPMSRIQQREVGVVAGAFSLDYVIDLFALIHSSGRLRLKVFHRPVSRAMRGVDCSSKYNIYHWLSNNIR